MLSQATKVISYYPYGSMALSIGTEERYGDIYTRNDDDDDDISKLMSYEIKTFGDPAE